MKEPTDYEIWSFHNRVRRHMERDNIGTERYPGRYHMDFVIEYDRPWYPYSEQKLKKGGNMFGIRTLNHNFEVLKEDLRLVDKKCDHLENRVDDLFCLNVTLDQIKAGHQRFLKEQEEFKKKVESDLRVMLERIEGLETREERPKEMDDTYALAEEFRRWYAEFVRGKEDPEEFASFVKGLRKKYKVTKA